MANWLGGSKEIFGCGSGGTVQTWKRRPVLSIKYNIKTLHSFRLSHQYKVPTSTSQSLALVILLVTAYDNAEQAAQPL